MKKAVSAEDVPEKGVKSRMSEKENTVALSGNLSTSSEKENASYLHSVLSEEYSVKNTTMNSSSDLQAGALLQEGSNNDLFQEGETMHKAVSLEERGNQTREMQEEKGFSWESPGLIEKYSPGDLANALKNEGFGCFLTLLRSSAAFLKKPVLNALLQILKSISVEIHSLVKCTLDPMRNLRYASTFLCCEILKMRMKTGEDVDVLFERVLMKRYKDIDANIRSLTIVSLMDVLLSFPTLFDTSHFNIFAKSITDKNEMVRRKSVRAMKKLLALGEKETMKVFYLKSLKVIGELALFDRCDSVRSECAGLLFSLYESKIVKKEACFGVLHHAHQRVFRKIFGEIRNEICGKKRREKAGENVLLSGDAIHELFNINEKALKLLKFTQEDLNGYIEDVISDVTCSRGCRRPFSCKLKILSVIVLPNTPLKYFVDLLGVVRENPSNVELVLEALLKVDVKAESEETEEIAKTLFNLDRNFGHRFLDPFLRLLKKVNGAISTYYVERLLSEETCVSVARYFDVSHFQSKNALFQCYCFLWRTISKDFREIHLGGGFDEDLSGLFNFLLFFKEKSGEPSAIQDAIIAFYTRLEEYVQEYLEKKKLSQDELVELGKLAKKGILADRDDPLRKEFLKQKVLENFFASLFETRKLDRALARKVSKETKGADVFGYLKSCAGNDLEGVCEFFIAHLNQTEAIYLESKSRTKKVKNLLLRKINTEEKDEFPKSPVRENEDVVSL